MIIYKLRSNFLVDSKINLNQKKHSKISFIRHLFKMETTLSGMKQVDTLIVYAISSTIMQNIITQTADHTFMNT